MSFTSPSLNSWPCLAWTYRWHSSGGTAFKPENVSPRNVDLKTESLENRKLLASRIGWPFPWRQIYRKKQQEQYDCFKEICLQHSEACNYGKKQESGPTEMRDEFSDNLTLVETYVFRKVAHIWILMKTSYHSLKKIVILNKGKFALFWRIWWFGQGN